MRQAIRLLCVVLLTAVPLAKATADMSPEMYFLAWEIKRNFEIDSTQTTRGPDCRDDCFRQASEALREMIKAQAVDRVVVQPLADGAKFGLSALGLPNVAMSTYNAVNCYLNESTQAGFKACMIKEALSLAVGEGLQKGADWDNLSSSLAGAAWDKAYAEIAQAVNHYQARSETAIYTATRDCTVEVYLRWNKHKVPGANGGRIYVRFELHDCKCPTGNSTRQGSISFYVPVHHVPAGNNEPGFEAGSPEEYRLRSVCCNGRGDNRTHLYNQAFQYMGVMKDPGEEPPPTTEPPTAEPPATELPPLPPVTSSPADWTEENPCPECQPLLDEALQHARAAFDLETQIEEQATKAATNRMRQEAARNRISRIQKELSGKKGEGGSSYDPETGITVDSWTQADGTVKVTIKDKNGNVVDEYTRPRRDTKKLREDLDREQQELEALEAEGKALEEELSRLRQQRQSELDQEKEARRKLADCVREHCHSGSVMIGDGSTGRKMCTFPDPEPVQIGPRSEFGEKSVADKAGDKAKDMISGLVGGAIGGKLPGGFGGPKRGGRSDGPKTVKDPVKNRQLFTGAGGTAIKFGTASEKGGGERVSVKVQESPSKGVVHTISRETLGPDCEKQTEPPIEYWLYELWAEWSLKVWWTKDTYVNNQLVKHEEGGWQESGKTMLDSGIFDPQKDIPFTAWGQLGFNRAFEGPRAVGASFPAPKPGVPERYVIQVSEPQNDPVTTTPFAIYPIRGANGKVEYTDKQPDWSAMQ